VTSEFGCNKDRLMMLLQKNDNESDFCKLTTVPNFWKKNFHLKYLGYPCYNFSLSSIDNCTVIYLRQNCVITR